MAKSVCVKNVGDPLTKVAMVKCSVADAKRDWSAKSAPGGACATTGVIRIEKKKSGRQALYGMTGNQRLRPCTVAR
jgi:hypothetical protein